MPAMARAPSPPSDAAPCDLVILDLMLPGMQGETVLEALRDAVGRPGPHHLGQAQRRRAHRRACAPAPTTTSPSRSIPTSSPLASRRSCVARAAPAQDAPPPILASPEDASCSIRLAALHAGRSGAADG